MDYSPFGVFLLQCGLIYVPQSFQESTCCVTDLSTATDALKCSSTTSCIATDSSRWALQQNGLIHGQRCFEVYLFQCVHTFGPQCLQRHICCSTDITTATDTSRCTCSGMDLSRTIDASVCPVLTWACSTGHSPFDSC